MSLSPQSAHGVARASSAWCSDSLCGSCLPLSKSSNREEMEASGLLRLGKWRSVLATIYQKANQSHRPPRLMRRRIFNDRSTLVLGSFVALGHLRVSLVPSSKNKSRVWLPIQTVLAVRYGPSGARTICSPELGTQPAVFTYLA